jgi:ATP-dependent DNA ligase
VLEAGKPLVINVEFRGWTPADELRHAVFKGWHKGQASGEDSGATLSRP